MGVNGFLVEILLNNPKAELHYSISLSIAFCMRFTHTYTLSLVLNSHNDNEFSLMFSHVRLIFIFIL